MTDGESLAATARGGERALAAPMTADVIGRGRFVVFSFSITHADRGGGVAFAAHTGGFAFGFLAIKAFQVRPPLATRGRS